LKTNPHRSVLSLVCKEYTTQEAFVYGTHIMPTTLILLSKPGFGLVVTMSIDRCSLHELLFFFQPGVTVVQFVIPPVPPLCRGCSPVTTSGGGTSRTPWNQSPCVPLSATTTGGSAVRPWKMALMCVNVFQVSSKIFFP